MWCFRCLRPWRPSCGAFLRPSSIRNCPVVSALLQGIATVAVSNPVATRVSGGYRSHSCPAGPSRCSSSGACQGDHRHSRLPPIWGDRRLEGVSLHGSGARNSYREGALTTPKPGPPWWTLPKQPTERKQKRALWVECLRRRRCGSAAAGLGEVTAGGRGTRGSTGAPDRGPPRVTARQRCRRARGSAGVCGRCRTASVHHSVRRGHGH